MRILVPLYRKVSGAINEKSKRAFMGCTLGESMFEVRFYDTVADELLVFAVIVARHQKQWVFCKHKYRSTYECPGGHREPDEPIERTAERELWEETGANKFALQQICAYSCVEKPADHKELNETFGMLYYAEIESFGGLPGFEIGEVLLTENLPGSWTYPLIQPILVKKVIEALRTINSQESSDVSTLPVSTKGFWKAVDVLIAELETVIDRPKGSRHPTFGFEYPLDYGYLSGTRSSDGESIDVWVGSLDTQHCDALICTIDLFKRDSEIKLLLGCTDAEKSGILELYNNTGSLKALMIAR
jgi:8-oxo-dGTP diphosphatase